MQKIKLNCVRCKKDFEVEEEPVCMDCIKEIHKDYPEEPIK